MGSLNVSGDFTYEIEANVTFNGKGYLQSNLARDPGPEGHSPACAYYCPLLATGTVDWF